MIDLYSWATPNGHKVHIMLEETGLQYRVHPINIGEGDQFKPEFLRISPNNKMPAMVDPDGPRNKKTGEPFSMFESGAILIYLASKTGKFLPEDLGDRWSTLQWLMFQMGGLGPMLGQAHHFLGYAPEKIPYAMNRYAKEANRLYGVLERRLGQSKFIACDKYTIADIAIMPWLRYPDRQGVNMDDYPHVRKWFDGIAARPAVQRGLQVLANLRKPVMDDKAKEILFGATQYQKR
jgi:GST-like protein